MDSEEVKEDGMFFQIQCIMAYLMESKKQYFSPEKFWSSFKLFGESINVREQQDAFEFFNSLTDQLDEELKVGCACVGWGGGGGACVRAYVHACLRTCVHAWVWVYFCLLCYYILAFEHLQCC